MPVPSGYQERASGNPEAIAGVVLAHPTMERGLVILGRARAVFIDPLVEGILQCVNIPVGEFFADMDNCLLG